VTQGGGLLAKLFNIIINAVVRERMRLMCETRDDSEGGLTNQIKALSLPSFMLMMGTSHQEMRSSFRRPSTS
jgi:hypothetical protein